MIYKFYSIFQRLIVVEHQIENVYELTKQYQRIYEKNRLTNMTHLYVMSTTNLFYLKGSSR